jgi:hypothetical protein
MFVLVGWGLALACIFGVYIVHGGNIGVILHALPFELITIFGAATGAFLANNQMKVIKAALSGMGRCFKGSKYSKARYMEMMALLYDILQKARKEGLMSIEKDVEEPHTSAIFQVCGRRQRSPRCRVHHRLPAHDGLGQSERPRDRSLMDSDQDAPQRRTRRGRGNRASGRGLPAFGIVAAVLGGSADGLVGSPGGAGRDDRLGARRTFLGPCSPTASWSRSAACWSKGRRRPKGCGASRRAARQHAGACAASGRVRPQGSVSGDRPTFAELKPFFRRARNERK